MTHMNEVIDKTKAFFSAMKRSHLTAKFAAMFTSHQQQLMKHTHYLTWSLKKIESHTCKRLANSLLHQSTRSSLYFCSFLNHYYLNHWTSATVSAKHIATSTYIFHGQAAFAAQPAKQSQFQQSFTKCDSPLISSYCEQCQAAEINSCKQRLTGQVVFNLSDCASSREDIRSLTGRYSSATFLPLESAKVINSRSKRCSKACSN